MSAVAIVRARYDQLSALVRDSAMPERAGWEPLSAELSARATAHVHGEARRLDARDFDGWLAAWTDDAVLWVPLAANSSPAEDQSLFLDDRRRLVDRLRWLADPSAWAQHPPPSTVRLIGSVEAWRADHGSVVVRSAIVMVEQRLGETQVLAGHQVHELVGDQMRPRSKVLLLPALQLGVRNPSFLL